MELDQQHALFSDDDQLTKEAIMTAYTQDTTSLSGNPAPASSPTTGGMAPASHYDPIAVAVAVAAAVMTCQTLGIQIQAASENNELNLQQMTAKISDQMTQKNIDNIQQQITKMAKMHVWGQLAKVFGIALLLVASVATILSGGIASGLMMLIIGALTMSGAMGSDGCIGKEIDKVADDLSKALGIQDPTIMRAVCEAVVVVSTALASGGTSLLDGVAAKGVTKLTGVAFKEGAKTLTKFLVLGTTTLTQMASSTGFVQNSCQAISNAVAPNGGQEAELITEVVSTILNVALMITGAVVMGAYAFSNIDRTLSLPTLVRKVEGVISGVSSTGQVIASLGGGTVSISAGVTKLKGADAQASLAESLSINNLSGEAVKANQDKIQNLIKDLENLETSLQQLPEAWGLTGNQMASPAA